VHPAEHLGRKDNVLTAGVTPDRTAHHLLGRAELVDVRGIPERDPGLDGLAEEWLSIVVIECPGVRSRRGWISVAHAAQRDAADLQPGFAQANVLHRSPVGAPVSGA
jgi:hypothetical protein